MNGFGKWSKRSLQGTQWGFTMLRFWTELWWADVCLKITQPATQWQSACRVQPPEPLQRGKKTERESTAGIHALREGEGSQYKTTTRNNPRYKDIEQEPTLFYKSFKYGLFRIFSIRKQEPLGHGTVLSWGKSHPCVSPSQESAELFCLSNV